MSITPGSLWAKSNHPIPVQRWWSPANRSQDGYNVQYERIEEEENPDWKTGKLKGSGGNGTVFRVNLSQHGFSPIEAAVKRFIPNDNHVRKTMRVEMGREINIIKTLHHIHVIEIIGSYDASNEMGFFMRPCAAGNLAHVLGHLDEMVKKDEPGYPPCNRIPQLLASTMGCLAHALLYIHDKMVKHKDIKPANILIDGYRVILADFGLSKIVEKNNTASSGPTASTNLYAPIEIIDDRGDTERSRSQDVFSLGCCFIEIFAGYKGKSPSDVKKCFGDGKNVPQQYARHIPKVLTWMRQNLVSERCDVQLWDLVRQMVAHDRDDRPLATEVWEETVLMSSTLKEDIHFCGACCMPIKSDNLSAPTEWPPSLDYTTSLEGSASERSLLAGKKADFATSYPTIERVPYRWRRNLRITNQAALDAVHSKRDEWLCRKIVFPETTSDYHRNQAMTAAKAEADMLEHLHTPEAHRHIVSLAGTYRQGMNNVLLIDPVAELDLKTYLTWVEEPSVAQRPHVDTASLLRKSFGCLANAVKHVHSKDIIHRYIVPSNILIMPGHAHSICLAEFGSAASETQMLGTFQAPKKSRSDHLRNNNYRAPETQVPERWEDIFSLGCVYVEIETVRKGLSIQQMRDFLAGTTGSPGQTTAVAYHKPSIMNNLPSWIRILEADRGTSHALAELMIQMVDKSTSTRPTIEQVLQRVSECKEDGRPLCGNFCMPR